MNIQYDLGDEWIDQKQMNKAINIEKKRQLIKRHRDELAAQGHHEDNWDIIIEEIMNMDIYGKNNQI